MFLEDFLYDHIGVTVAVLMITANWACNHRLITAWQYKVCALATSAFALYLTSVQEPVNRWTMFVAGFIAVLGWYVWKTRPQSASLDGSHEAL